MSLQGLWGFAAEAMVVLHMAYTAFVVLGQVAIGIGAARKSDWVRNVWFRSIHLASIAFVVGEAWLGIECPLTVAEHRLRELGGQDPAPAEFMTQWIERTTGFAPPLWGLTLLYSVFFATVAWAWWKVPPCAVLKPRPPHDFSRPPLPVVDDAGLDRFTGQDSTRDLTDSPSRRDRVSVG